MERPSIYHIRREIKQKVRKNLPILVAVGLLALYGIGTTIGINGYTVKQDGIYQKTTSACIDGIQAITSTNITPWIQDAEAEIVKKVFQVDTQKNPLIKVRYIKTYLPCK